MMSRDPLERSFGRENKPGTIILLGSFWVYNDACSGAKTMAKNEQTGAKAGKAASKVLRDGRTSKDSKTAAGSALSQRPDKKKK